MNKATTILIIALVLAIGLLCVWTIKQNEKAAERSEALYSENTVNTSYSETAKPITTTSGTTISETTVTTVTTAPAETIGKEISEIEIIQKPVSDTEEYPPATDKPTTTEPPATTARAVVTNPPASNGRSGTIYYSTKPGWANLETIKFSDDRSYFSAAVAIDKCDGKIYSVEFTDGMSLFIASVNIYDQLKFHYYEMTPEELNEKAAANFNSSHKLKEKADRPITTGGKVYTLPDGAPHDSTDYIVYKFTDFNTFRRCQIEAYNDRSCIKFYEFDDSIRIYVNYGDPTIKDEHYFLIPKENDYRKAYIDGGCVDKRPDFIGGSIKFRLADNSISYVTFSDYKSFCELLDEEYAAGSVILEYSFKDGITVTVDRTEPTKNYDDFYLKK